MSTNAETLAVLDAIDEARLLDAVDFAASMAFIPDEFHRPGARAEDRFVASVIANARTAGRSPYTVALFALDIA